MITSGSGVSIVSRPPSTSRFTVATAPASSTLDADVAVATLTLRGPAAPMPNDPAEALATGAQMWVLALLRALAGYAAAAIVMPPRMPRQSEPMGGLLALLGGLFATGLLADGSTAMRIAGMKLMRLGGGFAALANTAALPAFTYSAGTITGSAAFTVKGGYQRLSGLNSYTGITTINAGATLDLAGTGSILASDGLVNNGVFNIAPTILELAVVAVIFYFHFGWGLVAATAAAVVAYAWATRTITEWRNALREKMNRLDG